MPIGSTNVYYPGDLILSTVSSSGTSFIETKIVASTGSLIYFDNNARINSASLSSFTFGSSSYSLTSSYSVYAETASNAQNAQDILVYVKNTSGAIITKGSLVRIKDVENSGFNPTIELASFTNESGSANTLGYAYQQFAINDLGYVITEGKLTGVNTGNFSPGDLLYLSSSGQYTNVKPIPPNHGVRVGQVIRAHPTVGSIYVTIDNGAELDELHNVIDNSTTSSYGDLLTKSGSIWINSKNLTGSYTLSGSLTTNGAISALNVTASLLGTASWANNSISSSYALTASYINLSSSNVFVQGGNSFGTTAILGTNDASALSFETNGSTRATIDTNGNLGIGTTSPVNKLDVAGNISCSVMSSSFAYLSNIGFTNQITSSDTTVFPTGSTSGGFILDGGIYTNGLYRTRFVKIDRSANLPLYIQETQGSSGSFANLVRFGTHANSPNTFEVFGRTNIQGSITSSNFVGPHIGNTTGTASWATNALTASFLPVGTYNITSSWANNSISASYALTASYVNISSSNVFVQDGNSFGTTAILGTNDAQPLVFETSGSERMRIVSDGNVGIGTNAPAYKLDLSVASNTDAFVLRNSAYPSNQTRFVLTGDAIMNWGVGASNGFLSWDTGIAKVGGLSSNLLALFSNGSEKARIDLNGNVGIGTSSPGYKLDVLGDLRISGSTSTIGTFKSSASNCFISLIDSSGDNVFLGNDDGDFLIQTPTSAYSTKLIVKDDGNVGIGTTVPAFLLDVSGSSRHGFTSTNVHQFTGSVSISGSVNLAGSFVYDNAVLLDFGRTTTPAISTNYVVLQNITGSYNAAFFDYFASSGSNFRAGTVIAGWSGSSINYTEYSTTDIGNTNQLTMSVDLSSSFVRLLTTVSTTTNWNIKSSGRYL